MFLRKKVFQDTFGGIVYIKSMKRYILGINLPIKAKCHESGVALIDDDGNVVFAAAEERFSRKKIGRRFSGIVY